MNALDYAVLFGSILAIAIYGIIRTRGRRNLHDYLRGKRQSWFAIGLSVMATQASAITFLSTPGQGFDGGMAFLQNYFALPLALVIIAAFFLPIYRKLNVYTAYEFLGTRFDKKTRLLAAVIFLIQRGLGAGITIYAPAIVLSTVFGWNLPVTILASGIVVIVYTVAGGSDAVTHTQKYQIAIIFAGMITAFIILLQKIPCSFPDALAVAGHFGKLNAVNFSPNLKERYTFWSGMLGGIFLMLSYFGTDQSQVQRYISGDHLRESRLGLMFNALFKIPMQFGILFLGVMLFVFYLLIPAPIFFNRTAWKTHLQSEKQIQIPAARDYQSPFRLDSPQVETEWMVLHELEVQDAGWQNNRKILIQNWLETRRIHDDANEARLREDIEIVDYRRSGVKKGAIEILKQTQPNLNANDNDYVFITFILDNLPHGLIGLLVACFFAAALSSKAAELNALGSCTTIDFYRHLIRTPEDGNHTPDQTASAHGTDRHYVISSKLFTCIWGAIAILFALFAHMSENLIQAVNIVGSVFYGVVLGLFLSAFFLKFIKGTAAFCGAVIGQSIVFTFWGLSFFHILDISYLWYNLIGCLATVAFAALLQLLLGTALPAEGFPITPDPQS